MRSQCFPRRPAALAMGLAVLLAAACLAQSPTPDPPQHPVSVNLQSGFAETFQLTLGGVFGAGPAWQNRATISVGNLFRKGDAASLSGFATLDTAGHHPDWLASVSYKTRLLTRGNQQLTGAFSFERWRFPSVLSGAQDWLLGYAGTYTARPGRIPITVQSNAWTLLHSSLRKGSLVHTQVWASHPLYGSDWLNVTLRHGPQHTYSWNFYGTHGHRVVRYAGALVLTHGKMSFEAGYRPQYGLQQRIPDNRFWSLMLSQTF
ncbi:MAG: hypothetical protein IPJ98_12615 [Bryobacterales bacterium]|nr:hypothetical protein [Bryobacterales bacterium]